MEHVKITVGGFAALGLVGLLGLSACGDDSADDDARTTLDGGLDSGNPGSLDAAAGDSSNTGAVDTGTPPPPPSTPPTCNDGKWVHGGWITTQDTETGYLNSVTDLGASGRIDLSKVQSFDSSINYAAYADGVVILGKDGSSVLERWQLKADGSWTKAAEGDFRNQGVTSTTDEIHRVSATKGYYFDTENNQVVGFNPTTMLHDGVVIDLKPGLGAPGDSMSMARIHRSGDVFIVAARYWDAQGGVVKSIKAAFVDSTNNTVTFAEDTRCGGVYYAAADAAGNFYLGSHVSTLYDRVEGSVTSPSDSCLVRVKKGEKKFDPDYYVDVNKLLGGLGAGLVDGPGDLAFIEKYEGPQLTADNFREARLGAHWDVYSITLGDEAKTVAKVQLPSRTIAYPNSFVTRCGGRETGFLVLSNADWESGRIFQVTSPTTVLPGLTYTGSLGDVTRLD